MSEALAFIKKQNAYAAIRRNMNPHYRTHDRTAYLTNGTVKKVYVPKQKARAA